MLVKTVIRNVNKMQKQHSSFLYSFNHRANTDDRKNKICCEIGAFAAHDVPQQPQ